MGVAIHVGNRSWEGGTGSFLHCFFSTISATLEPAGWGSRFPALMGALYRGELPSAITPTARAELRTVHTEFAALPPSAVVWDVENRSALPPWGDNIAPHITSLANYFTTSDGKDLFQVLFAAFDESEASGAPVRIR